MIVDAREMPDGATIEADLCIIGAGAAGIAIAHKLAGSQLRVALLEAGGLDFDPDSQDVYRGRNTGLPYFALEDARLRFFGGTTNHWSGWCRPLDPVDFEPRPWVEGSGWPIRYADLEPYLGEATRYVELPAETFGLEDWSTPEIAGADPIRALPLAADRISTIVFQFSPPTRFGSRYRDALERSANVTVYLNAYATELVPAADGKTVSEAKIAPMRGRRVAVRARAFVLATGGIENARLLLLSRAVHAAGIGNQHDLVGRYFADHVELASGYVLLSADPGAFESYVAGRPGALAAAKLSPEGQARRQVLGCAMTFHPVADMTETSAGFGSLRRIVRSLAQGQVPPTLLRDVANVVVDVDRLAPFAARRALRIQPDNRLFLILNRLEIAPNPESRVTLDTERDAFGLNRVQLDWRLSAIDKAAVRASQEELGAALGAAGLGRVFIEFDEDAPWPSVMQGGYHHMGTTRMSDDPRSGVVDKDCRVHGMHNLYVAGSSTFRTTGVANPTLTILALALRLADQIKEDLA
jgi:choline dehydrogenase-like flavoprotein